MLRTFLFILTIHCARNGEPQTATEWRRYFPVSKVCICIHFSLNLNLNCILDGAGTNTGLWLCLNPAQWGQNQSPSKFIWRGQLLCSHLETLTSTLQFILWILECDLKSLFVSCYHAMNVEGWNKIHFTILQIKSLNSIDNNK